MNKRVRICAILLALASSTSAASSADDDRWERGLAVQFAQSRIQVSDVTTDWASDPQFLNGRIQQGPIYFNDCLKIVNTADIAATHVQVIFAPVDLDGNVKRPQMAFDSWSRLDPGANRSICRDHGYANGARGWWLVGWVSAADFADGSSWHAPTGPALQAAIVEAIPLTQEEADKAVLRGLVFHTPRIAIALDKSYEPDAPALEKLQLLTQSPPASARTFSLTEKGRAFAFRYGWLVRDGFVMIPVGRFVLDRDTPVAISKNGAWVKLTFRVRFDENNNGRLLASLIPNYAWHIGSFSGLALQLGDDRRTFDETISAVCSEHANCSPYGW